MQMMRVRRGGHDDTLANSGRLVLTYRRTIGRSTGGVDTPKPSIMQAEG